MNICTKLCANPSSRCYWWYFTVYMKTLTCWRHYRRSQGNRIHPLGTMNVSIKFICHPSNSSVSVWIKVVDRPTDWQTSGSNIIFHCGQQWNSGKCNLFWEKTLTAILKMALCQVDVTLIYALRCLDWYVIFPSWEEWTILAVLAETAASWISSMDFYSTAAY